MCPKDGLECFQHESIYERQRTHSRALVYVYRQQGLDAVLKRGYGIGRPSGPVNRSLFAIKKARWNTAEQARAELSVHFKRSFSYHQVWHWLKKCAGVFRVPRPVHEKGTLKRPKLSSVTYWVFYVVSLFLEKGRSRFGLPMKAATAYSQISGGIWTLKGRRPHKLWQSKYDWSYCYGALDPVEGKTVFVQTPSVSLEWTRVF